MRARASAAMSLNKPSSAPKVRARARLLRAAPPAPPLQTRPSNPPPALPRQRVTATLYLTAALGAIQSMQFGLGVGVPNAPQSVVAADVGVDKAGVAWSIGVIATFCIAGFLASTVAGGLADWLGRKRFIVLLNLPFLVAGALFVAAGLLKGGAGYALLVVGRVLVGAGAGAAGVVTPMYLGEVATPDTRGAFGALHQFAIVVLILAVQLAGLAMSTSALWGYLFGTCGALAALGLLTAPWIIESPRWLAGKGRVDEARKALMALRGCEPDEADDEMAEWARDAPAVARAPLTMGAVLAAPALRRALTVACVLQMTQQFSGINAVFYYSTQFFEDAGIDGKLGTVLAGAVNVVATGAAIPLIEYFGRKPLILAGEGGMLASVAVIVAALVAKTAQASLAPVLGPVAIVGVLFFVTFFEVGLGAIPWSIGAELFPEDSRGSAMAIAAAFNWGANTVVGIVFPLMQTALGNYSFLPFAAWLGVALVYTVARVPETKGKSPAELQRELNAGLEVGAGGDEAAEGLLGSGAL